VACTPRTPVCRLRRTSTAALLRRNRRRPSLRGWLVAAPLLLVLMVAPFAAKPKEGWFDMRIIRDLISQMDSGQPAPQPRGPLSRLLAQQQSGAQQPPSGLISRLLAQQQSGAQQPSGPLSRVVQMAEQQRASGASQPSPRAVVQQMARTPMPRMMKNGGSASSRADGIAKKGKTRGKMV